MINKIKNFFLSFALIFCIAAITSFTAYNWKVMNNFQKIGVPGTLIIFGLCLYIFLKEDRYKNLALFFISFLVGTLFAVFGQVYQTGADSWILFRNWAIFLTLPVIFSFSYSIFSLFIVVLCFMFYFYFGEFLLIGQASHISLFVLAFIILMYPILDKWLKFNFNDIFYNILTGIFYILFNITGCILILRSSDKYSLIAYENLDNILKFSYPMVLILLFLVCFKYLKKVIILPYTVMSIGIFAWSIFSKIYFLDEYASYDVGFFIVYFLISLSIIMGTFAAFIKIMPRSKKDFLSKILKMIGLFLKLFILMLGIGLLISIFLLTTRSYIGLLFAGLILIGLSCHLPKVLNFKEDKLEILTFLLGLLAINMFIIFQYSFYEKDYRNFFLLVSTVDIVIFNIFFYLRPNRAMDFLFLPAQISYIITIFNMIFSDKNFLIYSIIISIIALFAIPLELVFEEKINKSKFRARINRVLYGNSINLIYFFIPIYHIFLFSELNTLRTYYSLEKFRTIFVIIFSIFIVIFYLRKKEEKFLNIIIFSGLFIIIQFFASYIDAAHYIILLILLYTYKNYRWTTILLNIGLCSRIFYYYYSLSNVTLLKKSLYMLILSFTLLGAYLIVKYFVKEEASNE